MMIDFPVLTVTQLNQEVHSLLAQSFPLIAVQGEISNFICASSGHWYFSLKDAGAQVRCAMFKTKNSRVRCEIANGVQVHVQAQVSLYQPRGDFQLVIESIEPLGAGALQAAFEKLKAKLTSAGLFDERHKKALPKIPDCIGVITSPTGAAVQDILRVLKRRMPSIPLIIYPTLVQGTQAAAQIAHQIEVANQRNECEVLLLARGGGSLEDLWPFNEEIVAQAIFKSTIPIISGVGHQIDFTIADFVADLRAPTPSAAAELATPSQSDLLFQLTQKKQRLRRELMGLLQKNMQRLDGLQRRLQQAHPLTQMTFHKARLQHLTQQLFQHLHLLIRERQHTLTLLARTLHATSPLASLDRGYAIVRNENNHLIRHKKDVRLEETITAQLKKMTITAIVKEIK